MHLTKTHTKLNFNLKADFPEQNIFLTATTRGDNTIHKPIFVGIKKACVFNLATELEYVFDHGYAGDTYSLEDLIAIYGATTANKAPSSTF